MIFEFDLLLLLKEMHEVKENQKMEEKKVIKKRTKKRKIFLFFISNLNTFKMI